MIILKFRARARSPCPFVHNWISVYVFLSPSLAVDSQVSSRWMFVFAEFVVCRHTDLDPILIDISLYQNQMVLSSCYGTCDCTARCRQSKTAHADICHKSLTVFNRRWRHNFWQQFIKEQRSSSFSFWYCSSFKRMILFAVGHCLSHNDKMQARKSSQRPSHFFLPKILGNMGEPNENQHPSVIIKVMI